MTDPIANQLSRIVAMRAERALTLKEKIQKWGDLHDRLQDLYGSLRDLSSHPSSPVEVQELCSLVGLRDLAGRIDREALPRLHRVERRFSRQRINIGVAGKARVGKSTLLQSISGLGEDQVPTGDNLPVTAVRSRIFHSHTERALITFHTWQSFREKVLGPYFARLNWGTVPQTKDAFRRFTFPEMTTPVADVALTSSLRSRVQDMQKSFDMYESMLTGETTEIPLGELRKYVAYPTDEENRNGTPARLHNAVREASIECRFPGNSVQQLGLIDLPGTGEVVAAGEDRHVAGLEDEVDVVVLATNPIKEPFWGLEATGTLDLVLEARCGAMPADFAIIVINSGQATRRQCDALRDDILVKNADVFGGSEVRLLECNARQGDDVRERLVRPVLAHLVDRLPAMDMAALSYAQESLAALETEISQQLSLISSALQSSIPQSSSAHELLNEKTDALRMDLAGAFFGVVSERLKAARADRSTDEAFEDAVEACYQKVRMWISDGLGIGTDNFVAAAMRSMHVAKGSGGHAEEELNRIRVHLASELSTLDAHLCVQVEELWQKIWHELASRLGRNAAGSADGLRQLAIDLRTAGCPGMATAVEELLTLRLDYRTQFHPRLRRELDLLNAQTTDPETGELKARVVVTPDKDGAVEMLRILRELAERAAWEARKALLRDLSVPALVLHAAAEQFDDAFIRAGTARKEFIRFALNQRDEIWPDEFLRLDQAHGLFRACREKAAVAVHAMNQATGTKA